MIRASLLSLLLLLAACGGEGPKAARDPASAPAPASPSADDGAPDDVQADSAPAGDRPAFGSATVRGTVTLPGDAPRRRRIDLGADEYCTSAHPDGLYSDMLLVREDGAVANVFVHVKSGLPRASYPAPAEPVELDQVDCVYVPHVVGLQLGQKLVAKNSDSTMHNVHGYWEATGRDAFNFAQVSAGIRHEATLRRPGLLHVKCEVHSWMGAWVHVVRHPFFAVTGEDGTYEIGRLPPGTYGLEAWHEKLGTRTGTVEVGDDGAVQLDFSFGDG